tara:strand:- start:561 stop:812 length:252 start_codon:yes stop_codon:yes gene_type:complete
MEFYKTLGCNLYEIAEQTTDETTKKQLLNLWRNNANYNRAKEVVRCGASLHGEVVVQGAKNDISKLSGAKNLFNEAILDTFKS